MLVSSLKMRFPKYSSEFTKPRCFVQDSTGSFSPARHLESRGAPYVTAVRYLDAAWRGVAGPLGTLPPRPDRAVLSTILDELSGPLTSLLTSTSLLAEDLDALPPDKRAPIGSVLRKGLLLQTRLENLRCAATIWETNLDMKRRPVEPAELISEVLPAVMPLIDGRNQRLEVTIRDRGILISADPRRVAQTLVNLIVNASDHGGEGSLVGIRSRSAENRVRVAVVDRGPGIPEGRLPGLFELFHQPFIAGRASELSLGLPIVRAIVEAHGGQVGARNRPGGGARVWFELSAL